MRKAEESSGQEEHDDFSGGGLLFGITAWMLRALTENPFDGGGGFSIDQVAQMTPDQIYFRLCSKDIFRTRGSAAKGTVLPPMQAAAMADENGFIPGRDSKGNQIKLKMSHEGGLSHVQWLKKQAAEKEQAGKRRRRRRGN